MKQEAHQQLVVDIEGPSSLPPEPHSARISHWSKTFKKKKGRVLSITLVGIVLFVGLVSFNSHFHKAQRFEYTQTLPTPTGNSRKTCGSSPAQARELKCKFDIMMNGWVPLACYNEALSEEYLSKNDFHFYTDSFAQDEVPLDIVRRGEWKGLYTGWEHHIHHCSYMWKILVLAVEAKTGMFDSSSSSFDHTSHCSESMFEGGMIRAMMASSSVGNESFIEPGYLSCGQP